MWKTSEGRKKGFTDTLPLKSIRDHIPLTMPTVTMHRFRRYVYDLTDLIESLRIAAGMSFPASAVEAWILDELRLAYRVMGDDLPRTSRKAGKIRAYPGWGKLYSVVTKELLTLFDPMSHDYYDADFAEICFRHGVLIVSLYSTTETPLRGLFTHAYRYPACGGHHRP